MMSVYPWTQAFIPNFVSRLSFQILATLANKILNGKPGYSASLQVYSSFVLELLTFSCTFGHRARTEIVQQLQSKLYLECSPGWPKKSTEAWKQVRLPKWLKQRQLLDSKLSGMTLSAAWDAKCHDDELQSNWPKFHTNATHSDNLGTSIHIVIAYIQEIFLSDLHCRISVSEGSS